MREPRQRSKIWGKYVLPSATSIVIALLLTEGFLRISGRYLRLETTTELTWMRDNPRDLTQVYTIDPDFGFRPILGNAVFNEYGTHTNSYNETKAPGTIRLLFIGDSVTARGSIMNALKQMYGESGLEYWNAGVESFNTVQEVKFYKTYNSSIHPDHVILTFHLNDFETTPVAFVNRKGRLIVYTPHKPCGEMNVWLFKNSYLYRIIGGILHSGPRDKTAIVEEVQMNLQELKEMLHRDGISFSVLVLPLFKPYNEWRDGERQAREAILQILEDEGIRHFDPFEVCMEAIERGVDAPFRAGEYWHPSEEMSGLIARFLFEHELLSR